VNAVVALPEPPADADRLRDVADTLRQHAEKFEVTFQEALLIWNLAPQAYRAPEADALHRSLTTTRPVAREIAAGMEAACRAFERYADDLDELDRERGSLLDARSLGAPSPLWDEDGGSDGAAAVMNEIAHREWERRINRDTAALAEKYDEVTERCAAALHAIAGVPRKVSASWAGPEAAPSPSPTDSAGLALLDRLATSPDAAALLSAHPGWTVVIGRTSPAGIARWWEALDAEIAGALLTAVPTFLGNLDGVAIADRVAVHRGRAREYLRELRIARQALKDLSIPRGRPTATQALDRRRERARLDREIAYFQRVADGTKLLYAWDPDHGSLIEMTGDPSTAKTALFVVPGTNANADAFMSERPVTKFAEWQVRSGGGSVLAFTVLTGPMPQLSTFIEAGPEWNRFAEERGGEYARFIQGVDATRPGLWTMSYEHSYGGGVGSEAEKHGGTVDTRFLAASVGAIGPYEPHDGTAYFATQAADDINRYYAGIGIGPVGFSVAPESIPGVHIVDSGLPGPDIAMLAEYAYTSNPGALVDIVRDSVEHHTALMSDDESINGPVLDAVRSLLDNKGKVR
jgi:hypothetical protein